MRKDVPELREADRGRQGIQVERQGYLLELC